MILTRRLLDTKEQAKKEILLVFSEEPDEFHKWSEQDIYEQSRKIIARWDKS